MDLYRVFYYVARAGTVTKASQELFITQPSVSYLIKQLEDQLGVSLFLRKSKGVALTEEGKALLHYVEQAYDFLQAGEKKIEAFKNLQDGIVRIGVSESLCKHYLLPGLEAFTAKHPQVKIQLSHGKSAEIMGRLLSGYHDFGIVHLPVEHHNLVVRELSTIQDCFVVGKKYKFLTDSSISLKKLLTYPMITLSRSSSTSRFLDHFLMLHGLTMTPDIELGNVDLLKEFALRGFGITFVTKAFIDEELKNQTLFEIPLTEKIPSRRIGIIMLKETPLSLAAAALTNEL